MSCQPLEVEFESFTSYCSLGFVAFWSFIGAKFQLRVSVILVLAVQCDFGRSLVHGACLHTVKYMIIGYLYDEPYVVL